MRFSRVVLVLGLGLFVAGSVRGQCQWTQLPNEGHGHDLRGPSLGASVSLQGDVLAVGSPHDNGPGFGVGSVFLYRFEKDSWVFDRRLVVPQEPQSFFGGIVQLVGDRLLVRGETSRTLFIFRQLVGDWVEEARISGRFDSVDAEGDRIISGNTSTLSSTLYVNDDGIWRTEAEFSGGASTGRSVAIAGNYAAASGPRQVYIYRRENGEWSLV
jgi:hypothetical protein